MTRNLGAISLTPSGELRAKRTPKDAPLPVEPEGLRYRYSLMALHWESVRLKFPSRPAVAGYSSTVWLQHIEWLLSEELYGSCVTDPNSGFSVRPSWKLMLDFELQVLKRP